MAFGETKVYYDGSHYIAIPHTERPKVYRPKPIEEIITVADNKEGSDTETATEPFILSESDETGGNEQVTDGETSGCQAASEQPKGERQMTKRELFDDLYSKYLDVPKRERKLKIMYDMEMYFDSVEWLKCFVDLEFERKERNVRERRIRMIRKAYLANFNYFCTFTYDSAKHTEESFRKGLSEILSWFCKSKGWKYMGVWERSPEKHRLHFHCLVYVPDGKMVGFLFEKTDYSFKTHRMQTTIQNTYFNERFGRSDFEEIIGIVKLGESLAYLLKYIEKSGERVVYSKGLYQYFISDIMDEDIVCTIGQEDKKLLLFDDFNCWDEGLLMGRVSKEVIEQMRKSN